METTTETSCLGPLAGLQAQQAMYQETVRALSDPQVTTLVLVTRPEVTAFREAARTSGELAGLGVQNQHLVINGVFRAANSDDPFALALQRRGDRAMEKTPEQIRGLPRTAIPLSRAGVLGLPALRALGTDLVIASETVLTGSDDLVLPPTLGQLIDELAAPGHGVILAMGKGGVGKTTVAAAVAMALAERRLGVHLSTTDPAAHASATIDRDVLPNFTVSRIDPAGETARYTEQVIRESGGDLDASGKALLAEDLRSPCTEEIAVFRAFAEAVAEGSDRFVVLDTAPTGHTILLLDAALAYHREVTRQAHQMPESVERLLPRLRDAAFTRVLVVTLPEATPVHEAAQLQRDLRRAEIEPYAWIINQSLAPLPVIDPVLKSRQVAERAFIREVVSDHAARVALVPWQPEPPVGRSGQRRLLTMSGQASARQDVNWQLSGDEVAEESAPL